jgi:hypothetical protein
MNKKQLIFHSFASDFYIPEVSNKTRPRGNDTQGINITAIAKVTGVLM